MSEDFSIGVEEEYQLVDPATGRLRSCARQVLEMDWSGDLQPEMMLTTVEVGTPVCATVAQVRAHIGRLRTQADAAASARGLRIVAAGLHPDDHFEAQEISDGERYARLGERLGRIAKTDHIFGMHIHVAVPERLDRVALMGRVRGWIPHLIALAASSPVYGGEDTGFASYRTILAGRLPNGGIPPALDGEADFRRFMRAALDGGVLQDEGALYWSLRPHHRYPTLEFRAADVCPAAADAAAIAGLVRAVVVATAEGMPPPLDGAPAGVVDAALRANEWQAARYGLDATILAGDGSETVRDSVLRLLERLRDRLEAQGDAEVVDHIARLAGAGNAADRLRARLEQGATLAELTEWLAGETLLGTGMDRRAAQRMAAGA